MLAYAIYSEAGGVDKTTLAATLATAHADYGRDVLAIDLDPQQESLTYLLGVDAPRDDGEADNIARHLIDRPKRNGRPGALPRTHPKPRLRRAGRDRAATVTVRGLLGPADAGEVLHPGGPVGL